MISVEEMHKLLRDESPYLSMVLARDVVFEERVLLKCFHCKNYNKKWTCPKNIPDLNYKKIIIEYTNKYFVICAYPMSDNLDSDRNNSSMILHVALLKLEKLLWCNNEPLAVSFIGGSCKLCANGCGPKCANPACARIPIEATGVNVVDTLKSIGIDIIFPPNKLLYRIGMILW